MADSFPHGQNFIKHFFFKICWYNRARQSIKVPKLSYITVGKIKTEIKIKRMTRLHEGPKVRLNSNEATN